MAINHLAIALRQLKRRKMMTLCLTSKKMIYFVYPHLKLRRSVQSHIGQWGNSLAFRIPKLIARELNLQPNDAVSCRVENGKLVIEPVQTPQEYSLDELLEGFEPSEEVSWGKPEGNEVW